MLLFRERGNRSYGFKVAGKDKEPTFEGCCIANDSLTDRHLEV